MNSTCQMIHASFSHADRLCFMRIRTKESLRSIIPVCVLSDEKGNCFTWILASDSGFLNVLRSSTVHRTLRPGSFVSIVTVSPSSVSHVKIPLCLLLCAYFSLSLSLPPPLTH